MKIKHTLTCKYLNMCQQNIQWPVNMWQSRAKGFAVFQGIGRFKWQYWNSKDFAVSQAYSFSPFPFLSLPPPFHYCRQYLFTCVKPLIYCRHITAITVCTRQLPFAKVSERSSAAPSCLVLACTPPRVMLRMQALVDKAVSGATFTCSSASPLS